MGQYITTMINIMMKIMGPKAANVERNCDGDLTKSDSGRGCEGDALVQSSRPEVERSSTKEPG